MRLIRLKECLPDSEVEALIGQKIDLSYADVVVRNETTKVLKPDGSPLMIYVKDALPRSLVSQAFSVFKTLDFDSGGSNRGAAAGIITEDTDLGREVAAEIIPGTTRFYPIREDGTRSNTARAAPVPTAIIGYFDRYARTPYCRQTAFTMDNPELWQQVLPYIQKVDEVFKTYAPENWQSQKNFVDRVHPDFVIPGTTFTTLTVNRNWRTACHRDAGDYRNGLGCMTAMEGGSYSGGELIFPKYKCAVDMRTGGVALADVHNLHANAPIVGVPGNFVRISTVFYTRTGMAQCGSAKFEEERAKAIGDNISQRHATSNERLI